VSYEEQIMSKDKYPRIFSRQMEPIVYIFSCQMEVIVYIVFAPNKGYCVYYPSNLICNACSFENWEIFHNIILGNRVEYRLILSR